MNKTLILGSRHTGKTYRLIHEAIDAQGIIICATESSKDHINSILRECNHTEVPVFTLAEMKSGKVRGMAGPLFVDEAQAILGAIIAENVGNLPLCGYSFDTTNTNLFLLQNSI